MDMIATTFDIAYLFSGVDLAMTLAIAAARVSETE